MLYVLARIDVSGPVPVVVSVNYYTESNPTLIGNCRWWLLAKGDRDGTDRGRAAELLLSNGHSWAVPWLDGDYRLPHVGR